MAGAAAASDDDGEVIDAVSDGAVMALPRKSMWLGG